MSTPFQTYRPTCTARIVRAIERRPGNALNVEIGQALDRCMDKRPKHWPENMTAGRWLASGGNSLVLGVCSPACPRLCTHMDGASCWWCSADGSE